ncbi:MAG TPA: sulfur carrier protein ThiS [Candidatus Binatia bacterium]|jgi:sulfur carrier protein
MRLQINGEGKNVADGITVGELVASLGLAGRRVAVERNREVLPASAWPTQALAENDVLEIVHFVGGG